MHRRWTWMIKIKTKWKFVEFSNFLNKLIVAEFEGNSSGNWIPKIPNIFMKLFTELPKISMKIIINGHPSQTTRLKSSQNKKNLERNCMHHLFLENNVAHKPWILDRVIGLMLKHWKIITILQFCFWYIRAVSGIV